MRKSKKLELKSKNNMEKIEVDMIIMNPEVVTDSTNNMVKTVEVTEDVMIGTEIINTINKKMNRSYTKKRRKIRNSKKYYLVIQKGEKDLSLSIQKRKSPKKALKLK